MMLTIYYDGLCPLCSREIQVYREKDQNHRLHYIDITRPEFDALAEGLDPVKVHKTFHVKKQDSTILTGVEAFVAIWDELSMFPFLSRLAKSSVVRPFFELGYVCFSKVRPYFSQGKCEEQVCKK